MKKLTFLLFLILLIFQSTYGQSSEYQSLILDKSLKKNANSCIRSSFTLIEIESSDKMLIEHKQIITVFNRYGDGDIDAYLYYDENIAVKDLEAVIYDAVGDEIKKYRKKDFRDASAVSGGTLYSDSRVYYLDYTPIEYPYTVEFSYTIKNSNTAFVRPWHPINNFYQSVQSSEFIIEDLSDSKLRWNTKNLETFDNITIEESPNKVCCKAKNLSAIKYENYSPDLSSFTPQVDFALTSFTLEGVSGNASNWEEMGKWQYEELIKDRDKVNAETEKEILALTAGVDNPLEKVKIVYQYVQDNTRYISVQVGIGGWQPIDAETVDEVKYGDCKGLTNYTKALLKVVGINSRYTVVFAGSEKRDIKEDFASMQGNHVILNVPLEEKEIWLECTSQDIPFGFLGDFTDDRKVLVVDESGGIIKKTDSYFATDNYQNISAKVNILPNGDLKADYKIITSGTQFNSKYQLEKKPNIEVIKYYKSYYDHLKNLNIESFDFSNNYEHIEFEENIKFTTSRYASKFGNRFMFVPNVLNQTINIPDQYKPRTNPFSISRGFFDQDKVLFELPKGMQIESIPKPINITSKFGEYSAKLSKNEKGNLIYERSMLLNQGNFSKEEYPKFREFMKSVNKADQSKVILINKT